MKTLRLGNQRCVVLGKQDETETISITTAAKLISGNRATWEEAAKDGVNVLKAMS